MYYNFFICLFSIILSLYCSTTQGAVTCRDVELNKCLVTEFDLHANFTIANKRLVEINGLNLTLLVKKCSEWKKDSCLHAIYRTCQDVNFQESNYKAEPIINLFNTICHSQFIKDYSNNSDCLNSPEFQGLHNQVMQAAYGNKVDPQGTDPTGDACVAMKNELLNVTILVLKKCGKVAANLKRMEIDALIMPLLEENACSLGSRRGKIGGEALPAFNLLYILPIVLGVVTLSIGTIIAVQKYRSRSEYDEMIDDLIEEDEQEMPLTSIASEPSTSRHV